MAMGWGKAFKRKRDAHQVCIPLMFFCAYMGHDGTRLSCYRHAMYVMAMPPANGKEGRAVPYRLFSW